MSSEQTKFCYVISQLDHQSASEVEDIIVSPLEQDPYTKLKTKLVSRLFSSKEQGIRQLLTLEMGNRKPSQFLRHLRSLVPDMPDDFLCSIWSSQLSPNVQAVLVIQPKGDLNDAAHCADRIKATSQPMLTSIMPLPERNALLQQIEIVSCQVAALRTELNHLCSSSRDPRPSKRNRHSGSRFPSRNDAISTLCWYHRRYGVRA
jgi:hypothetical protein